MDSATTSTGMLEALNDPAEQQVWRDFDARYRPIVAGLGRRLGLSEEDAADLAQETLVQFLEGYRSGRYDRSRGRLRSWLLGIARHLLADRFSSVAANAPRRGQSALDLVPDEPELSGIWKAQRRRTIMETGLKWLRERTRLSEQSIEAFEAVALHQRSPDDVAEALGMTRHDVYVAKHRVAERLRRIVEALERTYDGEE